MPKPNILIDTDALSHLSQVSIDLNGQGVDKWLWAKFNLHTCTTVRDEFREGASKASAPYKALNRRLSENPRNENQIKTIPTLNYINRLETGWLSPKYYTKALSAEDRGERHLMCAVAQLVCGEAKGRFIVVSDDNTAVRKFIRPLLIDHPLAEVWTTLDLLIYMYLTRREVTAEFTKAAVRDVARFVSTFEFRDRGETEDERRAYLLVACYKRIDSVTKLRGMFPV